jgi:hypothetical protein
MNDLEVKVRQVLDEDARSAPTVGSTFDQVRPRVRRRQVTTVLTASFAAAALIAGSVLAIGSLDRRRTTPAPPATEGPSPASTIIPAWLDLDRGTSPIHETSAWEDPRDADIAGIDMLRVQYTLTNNGHWWTELAGKPPRDRAPGEVLSYGLALDTDEDGVADHVYGLEDLVSEPGEYHVWWKDLEDLETGATDEQLGPGYGFPIEFSHPDEQGVGPQMILTLLQDSQPWDVDPRAVRFFLWASWTRNGEVIATDIAPDTGWMTLGRSG